MTADGVSPVSGALPFPALRIVAREHPHPLLFATISGAHLYGFESPDSDVDLRGVHVLPFPMIVGLHVEHETLECSGVRAGLQVDLVTHDVRKFLLLLLKRNGYVLEQLFSPLIVQTTPIHDELKRLAAGVITRHHAHHYLGFFATQWRLFEQSRRIKPLLYAYRVLLTGIHLMRTGVVLANLPELNAAFQLPWIDELITRKRSGSENQPFDATDLALHERQTRRLMAELERASRESALPEAPTAATRRDLNALLLRVRGVS